MAAKDVYHATVKRALVKDGWTITHDPFDIEYEGVRSKADLGAEKIFAAQKSERKIAVEIKSFVSKSEINDLEHALGQYVLYAKVLAKNEPERKLFLAVRESVYVSIFEAEVGKILLEDREFCLIVFDARNEEIVKWIN